MLLQVRRWMPERPLVLVADSGYAALDFLSRLTHRNQSVTCITRLRLDARLSAAPERADRSAAPQRKLAVLPTTFLAH
jgi:hypothetical protein